MGQTGDKLATRIDSLILSLQEVADALRSPAVKLTAAQIARIEDFSQRALCLFCEQPLEGESRRGCHQGCYNTLRQRIARGEITTNQAVAKGWYDPRTRKPGRKTARPDPMRPNARTLATAKAVATDREPHRDKRKAKSP